MRIAIIADDLTGANDTGVQMARRGISTSVLINYNQVPEAQMDALVLDTDSRSTSEEVAYQRVFQAVELVRQQNNNGLIYKKVDSTMRGNLGAELDAVFDAAKPDFVLLAPSFPAMGRVVIKGHLYVHGVPLHKTSLANDPKNPVEDSYLPALLEKQTKRGICLIPVEVLRGERQQLLEQLEQARSSNTPYLLFDAEHPGDLQLIADLYHSLPYRFVCWGSAGLTLALSEGFEKSHQKKELLLSNEELQGKPALIVVGSVSPTTRKQLELVLQQERILALTLNSEEVLSDEEEHQAISNVVKKAAMANDPKPHTFILYSSGSPDEISRTRMKGKQLGLTRHEISDRISKALGRAASQLVQQFDINKLVLTGGDTAKQVCQALGVKEIELLDEVELGVPLGRIRAGGEIGVVTKAGGFGSDEVFIKALQVLGQTQPAKACGE